MSLAEVLGPLKWDAAYWLVESRESYLTLEDLGDICLDLEEKLTAIGIIRLLVDGDSDGFLHNVIRAAKQWQRFLERCRSEPGGNQEHNYCTGLFRPMLDALAGQDYPLATRLGELGPGVHRPGHEHEADFCYGRAVWGIHSGALPPDEVNALLDRCEEAGNEMSAARVGVARALLGKDQTAMEDAFATLVSARTQEIAADRSRGQVSTAPILAHREVFVEGIALLNLAESRGLQTTSDYPMCPSLARAPMASPYRE